MEAIRVIDSHTEGEPTRVVIDGAPDLGPGSASARLAVFREQHDDFRSALVNEPRGSDEVVGAVLLEPTSSEALAQVIFFNNVGYLHMCVHGTIGVARTLQHLGRCGAGRHRLETPVGDVDFEIEGDGRIAVINVASYRAQHAVEVETGAHGRVRGDVAWGGNWFFLVDGYEGEIAPTRIEELTAFSWDVRESLARAGICGDDAGEIDHVEVFGPPARRDADSKNFVLCPGKAYDRSPCGTGTSAKLACLAASGRLQEGEAWRQESTIGSLFEGSFRWLDRDAGRIEPTLRGGAWITAEATLMREEGDPFASGIRL